LLVTGDSDPAALVIVVESGPVSTLYLYPIRDPRRGERFRVHPDVRIPAHVFKRGDWYCVLRPPPVLVEFRRRFPASWVRFVTLHACVSTEGEAFYWPIPAGQTLTQRVEPSAVAS
jgi:hypothetical protein